jgi:MFS transporter, SET family, sugar efflux transporter
MLAPFRTDPVLRTCAVIMLLFGTLLSPVGAYLSTLGIRVFGLTEAAYAAVLIGSTILSVAVSVLLGIRADQTARRRGIMLGSVFLCLLGFAIMALTPGTGTFVLVHALILPLSGAIWGQVFATARQASGQYDQVTRDSIMAVIRAIFALPFVIALPLWSAAILAGVDVTWLYPVGAALTAVMALICWRAWPRDGRVAWADRASGLTLRAALAELADKPVASRLLALGAMNAPMTVYLVIAGLVFAETAGRGVADTAIYVGLIAGMEVPVMLLLPRLAQGRSRTLLMLLGVAVYGLHVALLPWIAASAWVWALTIPGAVGGAVVLLIPMAYVQDLLAERPGTGAALMALQRVIGEVLAALCFVIGTLLAGYGLVAVLVVTTAMSGAAWLWRADRKAGWAGMPIR